MQIRKALRLVFLAVAVAVAAVVYQQWRPAEGDVAERHPEVELPEERGVQSVTSALNVIQSSNGRPVFRIGADEHVDFEDGWNVWDRVRMDLYGVDPDGDGDDVGIVGDRMRTSGDIGKFNEIRIIGNVVVDLPGSGHFETRRIDYDAVSGLVSNCNRNVLTYAGLEVVSNCLEFRTRGDLSTGEALQADDLRMWGELSIRAVGDGEGTLPADLRGGGAELRFKPGDEFVYLDGEPFLDLGSAVVRSDALVLNVGQSARQLTGVDAEGAARLRVREQGAVADETGSVPDSDRDLVVRAETIGIDLDERTELAGLVAESDRSDPAALVLPDLGILRGVRIALQPASESAPQRVEVAGEVSWEPGAMAGGLRYLGADRLDLELGPAGPRRLTARGAVIAALEASAEDVREFTGEEMALGWDDGGALTSGSWPRGVRFEAGERVLEAGRAAYDPTTRAWRLSGEDPKPTVVDPQMSLTASAMGIGDDGALQATGGVTGTLGGGNLAAAAILFGGVEQVRVRAGDAKIDPAGAVDLGGRVEIVWEEQSLVAGSLRLETDPGRLRAQREVELVAVEGGDAEGFVTVTAENLLVEEETSEIRLAGQALMRRGDRQIQADKLTVAIGEDGAWSNVLAEDNVAYRDPQGEASGETLLYDLQTSEILLTGSTDKPAIFRLDDLEYASTEALRILFEDEQVVIEATEAGRTRTSVVPREGGTTGG